MTAESGLQRAWARHVQAVEQMWWGEARNDWTEARTSYVTLDISLIRGVCAIAAFPAQRRGGPNY